MHKHLLNYFLDDVALKEAQKDQMRGRRLANEKRLKDGLVSQKKPAPLCFVKQGSYAMHTMVQANAATSDIDDGVVFAKDDLVGDRGGEYTPLQAKNMVCAALNDKEDFVTPPEVRTNCVRIFYADGFTIDMPVYREVDQGHETVYELAAVEWKESNPEAVTDWFNTATEKSPDRANGRQLRRMVRLLKAWSKSRASWSLPSGFALSILTDEKYPTGGWADRDDTALYYLVCDIHARLQVNLTVLRPVKPYDGVTKSESDADMRSLRDKLADAKSTLAPLGDANATELEALEALKSFFCTSYFDEAIADLKEAKKVENRAPGFVRSGAVEPQEQFFKDGGEGRYA
ncbi:cyclic GMP-AMP synthase DncV-like nucleotidyltransferase [Cupriavidus basilensis]|uniref:cyclic GMP-AMP synthase DncV-like nucleotidyltransferase n=1 Tax=Cupriavidus basilensis TaxID=68895 RepID=UPI00345B2830